MEAGRSIPVVLTPGKAESGAGCVPLGSEIETPPLTPIDRPSESPACKTRGRRQTARADRFKGFEGEREYFWIDFDAVESCLTSGTIARSLEDGGAGFAGQRLAGPGVRVAQWGDSVDSADMHSQQPAARCQASHPCMRPPSALRNHSGSGVCMKRGPYAAIRH
jgi:hypothetical protein